MHVQQLRQLFRLVLLFFYRLLQQLISLDQPCGLLQKICCLQLQLLLLFFHCTDLLEMSNHTPPACTKCAS